MRLFESFTGLLLIVLLFVTKSSLSNKLDFALHFFHRRGEFFTITETEEFNRVKVAYKNQYKTVFLTHGWKNDWAKTTWLHKMKDGIWKKHDGKLNFFIVDWHEMANSGYISAEQYTVKVGKQLATFIAFIKEKLSANMDNVHLVGHSLGAQICGYTGKALQKNHNITIGKITGLDPAGPGFRYWDTTQRLDQTDAKLVEVLHTNMADNLIMGLGTPVRSGVVDIFLGGGSRQNGCPKGIYTDYDRYLYYYKNAIQTRRFQPPNENEKNRKPFEPVSRDWIEDLIRAFQNWGCPHSRAVDFYLDTTVKSKCNRICQPVAYVCDSYKKFREGECAECGERNEKCRLFEYNANTQLDMPLKDNYSYFLEGNANEPYCANHYQLEIQFRESNIGDGKIKITLIGDRGSHEWDDVYGYFHGTGFKAVVHTPKNLGVLKSATGDLGWVVSEFKTRTIVFIVMYVRYMSNMKPGIRKNMSAEMTPAGPLTENRYFRFDRSN